MEKYIVTDNMSLASGYVGLSPQQAKRRAHRLKSLAGEEGVYSILSPVQFKVGEEIKLSPVSNDRYIETHTKKVGGSVSKAMADAVKKVVKPTPKKGK